MLKRMKGSRLLITETGPRSSPTSLMAMGFISLKMLIRWAWLCASCCPYLGMQEVEAELGVETYLG